MTQILNMAISDYDDYGVVWGRAREGGNLPLESVMASPCSKY